MPKCKDNAPSTSKSSEQVSRFVSERPLPILYPGSTQSTQKVSNPYEKLVMPLKGILNPKIPKLSSNQG